MIILRPYQSEVAAAIMHSIEKNQGRTFTVEIARQGGKNELSAVLEVALLTLNIGQGGSIVKASPTFKPQTIISMERLKQRLDDYGFGTFTRSEMGYIISLGAARCIFLSADQTSNVVGHTADILLEMDEAQDIDKEKYSKEFRPMGAATNCTTVLYGTSWDDSTLLEQAKQSNLELERYDGIKRHFAYDWQIVAQYNPSYQSYVEQERDRLGENHPLFRTQYSLLPLQGGGRLLNHTQLAQLQGDHTRRNQPEPGKAYLAAIDLAGEATGDKTGSARDATVLTIVEISVNPIGKDDLPYLRIVEILSWTGRKHHELYPQLIDLLKNVWRCRRIVVDATGIGEPVASFLEQALGSRVLPFKFSQQSKSELGYNFLAAVNSGRLKLFARDDSREYRDAMRQLEKARPQYRPNQTMNFFVDPVEGHDDILMSLALAVEAARDFVPKVARGGIRHA